MHVEKNVGTFFKSVKIWVDSCCIWLAAVSDSGDQFFGISNTNNSTKIRRNSKSVLGIYIRCYYKTSFHETSFHKMSFHIMSFSTKCPLIQNVHGYKTSSSTKRPTYKMSTDTKVLLYKISIDTKFPSLLLFFKWLLPPSPKSFWRQIYCRNPPGQVRRACAFFRGFIDQSAIQSQDGHIWGV